MPGQALQTQRARTGVADARTTRQDPRCGGAEISKERDWLADIEKVENDRSFGRFFATSREKLREIAKRLEVRHLVNFVRCAAPS